MSTVVSIHQPNYIPWLGYFHKIASSDIFVILDNVQFSKGSVGNRNKIKNDKEEAQWLTVSLNKADGSFKNYNAQGINYATGWNKEHINTLERCYSPSPFFHDHFKHIREILLTEFKDLASLNISLIEYVLDFLEIKTRIVRASDIKEDLGHAAERVAKITHHLGGTIYLSGHGAKSYNDEALFNSLGISLVYTSFRSPTYPQIGNAFLADLSIIDILCNCPKSSIIELVQKIDYRSTL